MERTIKEELDKFLYAVEDFLGINAEYSMDDIKVIYVTQWQRNSKKLFARGVVKIGEAYYSFELSYNIYSNKLTIKSKAFLFQLTYEDIEEFLKQAEHDGDSS